MINMDISMGMVIGMVMDIAWTALACLRHTA